MAIVALVVTMESITTTFLNENICGVRLKDILKLRRGINLSLLNTIIILMLFTLVSLVSMIFNLFYTSLLMALFTIFICIWISIQDLPICFKNDKALINLLKRNKKNINISGLNNSETYNFIVLNLVNDKKIDKVYELLKEGKDKNLIDYIFNLIINRLTNFKHFDDIPQNKIEFDKFSEATLENIALLFNNKSKVFDDYDDPDKIAVYLARIFYYINDCRNLLDKTTIEKFELKFMSMFWLLFIKDEIIQKNIAFKTYQLLLMWSLRKCDLWVVKLLKKAYSSNYYTFSNYKLVNILFSEISFVLFYYYNYETLISDNKRNDILNFVKEKEVYGVTEIGYSWEQLFKKHLTNYSLNFHDLYKNINAEQFEFMLDNKCKLCLFSQRSLAEWWIKCLFCSVDFYQYDFNFLKSLDEKEKNILSYYLDSIFEKNSVKIKLDKSFYDFESFFNLSDKLDDFNDIYEKNIKTLFDFNNNCKKHRETEYISKANVSKDLKDLYEYLLKGTKDYLESLGFIDKTLDLTKTKAKGIYNLEEIFETDNAKPLYLDVIKNCFAREFNENFEKQMSNECITFNDKLKVEDLKKCLIINPTFTTEKVMYVLRNKTKIDEQLINKLEKLDESIAVKNNNALLIPYCYGNNQSVKFNYEIHTFELKPLTDEELLKIIDQYKSENGTYFYHGVQYSYNELLDVLKQKLFTMKIFLKYKIVYDKNNLCVFDPWGFYESRKIRKNSLKK